MSAFKAINMLSTLLLLLLPYTAPLPTGRLELHRRRNGNSINGGLIVPPASLKEQTATFNTDYAATPAAAAGEGSFNEEG